MKQGSVNDGIITCYFSSEIPIFKHFFFTQASLCAHVSGIIKQRMLYTVALSFLSYDLFILTENIVKLKEISFSLPP